MSEEAERMAARGRRRRPTLSDYFAVIEAIEDSLEDLK